MRPLRRKSPGAQKIPSHPTFHHSVTGAVSKTTAAKPKLLGSFLPVLPTYLALSSICLVQTCFFLVFGFATRSARTQQQRTIANRVSCQRPIAD